MHKIHTPMPVFAVAHMQNIDSSRRGRARARQLSYANQFRWKTVFVRSMMGAVMLYFVLKEKAKRRRLLCLCHNMPQDRGFRGVSDCFSQAPLSGKQEPRGVYCRAGHTKERVPTILLTPPPYYTSPLSFCCCGACARLLQLVD